MNFKEPVKILIGEDSPRAPERVLKRVLTDGEKNNLWLLRRHSAGAAGFRSVYVLWANLLNNDLRSWLARHDHKRSRYLLLGEELSADTFVKYALDLNVRRWDRLYTLNCPKDAAIRTALQLLLRLFPGLQDSAHPRILNATLEGNELFVVSTNFDKLRIPVDQVPPLKNAPPATLKRFEIDEDGAFIFWPDLDLHLGWEQLASIKSPLAALKAQQKQNAFNKRFGLAVQSLRAEYGLRQADVKKLSERQLQRIENGECRATSRALAALSEAHGLSLNDYLEKLAHRLN